MLEGNGTTATAELADLLDGGTLACVGSLGMITPEQLEEVVASLGGEVVDATGSPDVLLVGTQGLPLTERGEISPKLAQSGARRIVSEGQFLHELKVTTEAEEARRLFTPDALAQLLRVPRPRVLAWVRAGLIRPATIRHGIPRFEFRQVAAARTLADLSAAGVSTAKMRESLQRLRKWLPEIDEPLEQLSVLERAGSLMVRMESGEVVEPDGQFHMTYDGRVVQEEPPPAPFQLRLVEGPRSAADWHEQGVDQELHGLLADSERSYRQALLVGGPDAQICFDLAHVLAAQARHPEAAERYRQVVEIDPRRGDAWNNLGVSLLETGDTAGAVEAFREALRLDPGNALARLNLVDAQKMSSPSALANLASL